MAYWGIALVNGPHINFPMVPPDKAATAWESLTQAKRLVGHCSQLEKALVKALESRYANPQPEDRTPLDTAYAAAMREVASEFPNNPEATTLFAEAAMDLHPWDFWKNGLAQPWTQEILDALEQALAPTHTTRARIIITFTSWKPLLIRSARLWKRNGYESWCRAQVTWCTCLLIFIPVWANGKMLLRPIGMH